ncbi:MAG: hypothetical protein OR995_07310 [Candidatus Nanopelagicales bacterium]|nr:hypothetical protein [Candidatus Nanopelagicales bacterium]
MRASALGEACDAFTPQQIIPSSPALSIPIGIAIALIKAWTSLQRVAAGIATNAETADQGSGSFIVGDTTMRWAQSH